MRNKRMHVAVAVIRSRDNRVLLAKRHPDSHQGGRWEFPGGKIESGESVQVALARELQEELGISASQYQPLIRIPHDYDDCRVLLDVWEVTKFEGEPRGMEGQATEWVSIDELAEYPLPEANYPIIRAINLPDTYLITPEPGETVDSWYSFLARLKMCLDAGIKLIQFRAKSLSRDKYIELGKQVLSACHDANCKVLLNSDVSILNDLSADGLHINSSLLMKQKNRAVDNEILLSASCHNIEELQHAEAIRCDFAVLSPVLETSSHPDIVPLGWDGFSNLSNKVGMPVYALGGMSLNDMYEARLHGAQGISGISALWKYC